MPICPGTLDQSGGTCGSGRPLGEKPQDLELVTRKSQREFFDGIDALGVRHERHGVAVDPDRHLDDPVTRPGVDRIIPRKVEEVWISRTDLDVGDGHAPSMHRRQPASGALGPGALAWSDAIVRWDAKRRYRGAMGDTPERVEVSATSVAIVWDDGGETLVSAEQLRDACPCAGCREGRAGGSALKASGGAPTIVDARFVGSYAVNFTFGDGHGDGIYPFSMLRSLADS